MTSAESIELLIDLASTPSVSGSEDAIAGKLEAWMGSRSWNVERVGNSVLAVHGPGPYLLLNSHLDTVPECDGWTRNPYDVCIVEDKIFGLGTNDAKGSVACLLSAFDFHVKQSSPVSLIVAIVEGEETSGVGMTNVLDHLASTGCELLAGVVGEPTSLDVAVAQKGLLIFELRASGTPCHAARAAENNAVNPIEVLARDVSRVSELSWETVDSFLGPISIQPTMVNAGTAKNQIPGVATVAYDVRTTNAYTHDEILERIAETVESDVVVHSSRLRPSGTAESERIVLAARSARPSSALFGSATMSDMVFLQNIPAIKVGPGVSTRSHTPDEYIRVSEVTAGAAFYRELITSFHSDEKEKIVAHQQG